jgi:hypothetical protein
MMFFVIVSKIYTPWSPINVKLFVADSFLEPIVSHFHCFGTFLSDGFILDAKRRGLICAERCCRLNVSQFIEFNSAWCSTLALWKHAPTSDSSAEATTFLVTDATLRIEPLIVSSCGVLSPQNNKQPRRMRAFET